MIFTSGKLIFIDSAVPSVEASSTKKTSMVWDSIDLACKYRAVRHLIVLSRRLWQVSRTAIDGIKIINNNEIILLKSVISVLKEAAIESILDADVNKSFHVFSGCQYYMASLNQISLPKTLDN